MSRSLLHGLVLIVPLLLIACDKEEEPVAIPFKPDQAEPDKPPPAPVEPVEPTAPIVKRKTKLKLRPRPVVGVENCCGALRVRRARGRTSGEKSMYTEAISICNRQATLVRSGKTSRARALGQVRGALLDSSPSQCR